MQSAEATNASSKLLIGVGVGGAILVPVVLVAVYHFIRARDRVCPWRDDPEVGLGPKESESR